MPFAPLLRTTLLLSSFTLAASYALYETNPQFRNLVDSIVDKIFAAWDHVLTNLSPQEAQRQREAQRREVLIGLTTRGDGNVGSVFERRGSAGGTVFVSGVDEPTEEGKGRRRRLWETAEKNMENLRAGAGARLAPSSALNGRGRGGDVKMSNAAPVPGVGSLDADVDPPLVDPSSLDPSVPLVGGSSTTYNPPTGPQELLKTTPSLALDTSAAVADDDDARSLSGTSTASRDSYSQILTPTSPSLQSVSGSDLEYASAADAIETASNASTETLSMSQVSQSAPPSVADSEAYEIMSVANSEDGDEARSVSEFDDPWTAVPPQASRDPSVSDVGGNVWSSVHSQRDW